FNWVVLVYAIAVAGTQLLLVVVAAGHIVRTLRRDIDSRMDDVFAHPRTPAVSVLVPAFNEEATIVESVRSVLALNYPEHETIVVDDGSTDRTFAVLEQAYDLVVAHRVVPARVPVRGQIRSVHAPRDGRPLIVIRKENAGRCADALNAALNAARTPLVCMVDADSVIEPDALLHVVRPFVEHPDTTVAAGGVIRPSNGVRLRRGTVDSVSAPGTLLARIQVVEYLRAFLLGRVGWTWLNGVLIISGAFGIFRREDVIALGGLKADSLGQDADLVAALHNTLRRRAVDYRMVIVPQPVCWTQVPETRRELAKQRRRWSHGLADVLWRQRTAFGRRRYGRFGLVILPYHLLFELLGPVVEVLGVPAVIAAWALGLLNGWFAVLVFTVSVGFGSMVSLAAVFLDEVTFHRYERPGDLLRLVLAALLESTGLRWLHSWWRLRGLLDAVDPRRRGWGTMSRVRFLTSTD
ncbi:MAG TPA: glycosyltransferase family 2 protein, partial [Kineosporiaceae bacterium]|nr:glycosyltransferase family 2 protein [Kineosporiaceae bacterium]